MAEAGLMVQGLDAANGNIGPKVFDDVDEFETRLLALYVPLIVEHNLPEKMQGDVSVWADEWQYDHIRDFYSQIRDKVGEFVNGPKPQTSDNSSITSAQTVSSVS